MSKFAIFKDKVALDPLLEDRMNQDYVSVGNRKYI